MDATGRMNYVNRKYRDSLRVFQNDAFSFQVNSLVLILAENRKETEKGYFVAEFSHFYPSVYISTALNILNFALSFTVIM